MVHIRRDRDGRRSISEIKEILGYENGKFILNDLMAEHSEGIKNIDKAILGGENHAEILSRSLFDRNSDRLHLL